MDLCIVGTGYVGLVTAACFAETGNNVICVDINEEVVTNLKQGKVHIFEPGLEELVQRNLKQGRLDFTTDIKQGIDKGLFIFICVGTPPKEDGSCDMRYVESVTRDIGKYINEYRIVVNKSTVPVGTADRVRAIISEEIAKRGVQVEFDVVSNPEFLKEGDAVSDFMKPDRIIVGTDNVRTAELLKALYAPFARSREKLIVMGIRSAEMTKYAANAMLATKISFINEIANICEQVGADIADVRLGIGADHRIGYHFIYPGVGYGGSCFPKDVRALINTANEIGYSPKLLSSVHQVNEEQKRVLARKVESFFSDMGGIKGKTIAIWGLAFKANTDDIRESSALTIIEYLTGKGMKVRAFDPKACKRAREYFKENPLVEIVDGEYEALDGADALGVVTEWNQFRNPDFIRIKNSLKYPVIFDGRNLYNPRLLKDMGFEYFGIGRR
ncbi:UDP-glucose/GDP-mannose dehydrogenase family protein [Desulfothermus okinawensis JCM 13304]